jgi:hypothetical protein
MFFPDDFVRVTALNMMFPQLAPLTDVALLLLRIMIGIVFLTSGWKHLTDPEKRSKDIGMRRIHHFSGRGGVCRKLGRDLWRPCSTRFHRFDLVFGI